MGDLRFGRGEGAGARLRFVRLLFFDGTVFYYFTLINIIPVLLLPIFLNDFHDEILSNDIFT